MGPFPDYSGFVGTHTRENPVVASLRRYLDRIFDRVGDRVGDRVAERLEATLDVLTDPDLMNDLREADSQPDEEARSYDEIRRKRGLATPTT
jgi:hypothetical protein